MNNKTKSKEVIRIPFYLGENEELKKSTISKTSILRKIKELLILSITETSKKEIKKVANSFDSFFPHQ